MDKSIYSQEYQALLLLLKEERIRAGLTQVQLAKLLNESQTFISKCERNERRIDVIELREFCVAMGVDFRSFIDALEQKLIKLR